MDSPRTDPQPRVLLTEARMQRGWSQQEVANRLGTTHVNVSRWERGLTKPNPYYRRKLCILFGKTEEELGISAATNVPTPPPSPASTTQNAESAPPADGSPHPATIPSAPMPIAAADVIYDPAIPLELAIPLVGREELLGSLKRRLRSGGSVALTALNGLPGVGKTALSITLAHDKELRAHFRDGVLWAGLGPDPNIPGLLSRWGTMLGISASEMQNLSGNEAWARAIHAAIGTRALLLVIDDAWTIEDALLFKIGGTNCAHLVTTRFGAIAVQMAGDGATTLQELNKDQSMELLTLLAPNAVGSDESRAQDLVQAVGGLPLALTLMGNYLRKQSYSGQARRIRVALEKLSDAAERLQVSEPRGPAETHPSLPLEQQQISLQTVIAVTDQQLTEEARQAFYALAVFPPKPNSFSEEAALAVTASNVEIIDLLADTGLLESSGEGRYTLHQTISDYARVHLKDPAPYQRLITYAIEYSEGYKKDYSYELLDRESSTILAALDAANSLSQHANLLRLIDAYVPTLLRQGSYALAEQHVKRLQEASNDKNDYNGKASALLYLGQIAQKLGDLDQAEICFIEGLQIARRVNNKEQICVFLIGLGEINWRRAEHTNAELFLQEGLTLARQLEDNEHICTILRTLGSLAARQGNYVQSIAYLKEGLPLAREIGDREQLCVMLMNLGATFGEQGRHTEAEVYFKEGLVLARQIGHHEWTSALLSNLGSAAAEQGQHEQAELYLQEGLALAKRIGHREWTSLLLCNLGLTMQQMKNYKQSELYFQESLDLARQINIPQITSNILNEYGDLYLSQDKLDEAEEIFKEMLAIVPDGGQYLRGLAQYGLAQIALKKGSKQDAQRIGEESAAILESLGYRKAEEVRSWLRQNF